MAFLGRYSEAKGVHRLLRLWPRLNLGPARLDFYGAGVDGSRLQEEIARLRLGDVHVNGGWVSAAELGEILDRTDLVVLPSETEGLPVVLLEAMAYGVPFVATDVGAVRTLAENNSDVRVVSLDDNALRAGIEEMAADIRAGRVRGERLQQYHRSRYSHEILSRRWASVLLNPQEFWRREQSPSSYVPEYVESAEQSVAGNR